MAKVGIFVKYSWKEGKKFGIFCQDKSWSSEGSAYHHSPLFQASFSLNRKIFHLQETYKFWKGLKIQFFPVNCMSKMAWPILSYYTKWVKTSKTYSMRLYLNLLSLIRVKRGWIKKVLWVASYLVKSKRLKACFDFLLYFISNGISRSCLTFVIYPF